eukprot:TRINITY_DN17002_c0_g1_i1.p1 TRINITY_DN17002_c0_g1~~TRINITY_DN17002_c0_g1_i1.p1  ORF type:complete len:606 (+),score=141.60 TRINITY_DN17002_c0_g1_i1:102-1919(+)
MVAGRLALSLAALLLALCAAALPFNNKPYVIADDVVGPCTAPREFTLSHSTTFAAVGYLPLNSTSAKCTQSQRRGTWFRFAVQADGVLQLDTCNCTWDTVLEAETADSDCAARLCMAFDDDGCGFRSRLSMNVVADALYYVLLRDWASTSVNLYYILNVAYHANVPVAICGNNYVDVGEQCDGGDHCESDCTCDDGYRQTDPVSLDCESCSKAQLVLSNTDCSYEYSGNLSSNDTITSTCISAQHGVYYSFQPLVDGVLHVDTCGTATLDTILSVEAHESCNQTTCLARNDDTSLCGGNRYASWLNVDVAAGTIYDVLLTAFSTGSQSTAYTLTLTFSTSASALISSSSVSVPCVDDATLYNTRRNFDGEIYPSDTLDSSCWEGIYGKWYQFTPFSHGQVDFYLCSSSYAYLTVVEGLCSEPSEYYHPPYCSSAQETSWHTENCATYGAAISFYCTGGATYYLLVSTDSQYPTDFVLTSHPTKMSASYDESEGWSSAEESSSWFWSVGSNFDDTLFWVIIVPTLFGLGLCMCCAGVCALCLRFHRQHQVRAAAVKYAPVAQAPVHLTVQAGTVAAQVHAMPAQQAQPQYLYVPYPYSAAGCPTVN